MCRAVSTPGGKHTDKKVLGKIQRQSAVLLQAQKRRAPLCHVTEEREGITRAPGSLLNTEVGEHLGLGFFHGEQIVAGGKILRDAFAVFGRVVSIVATEAT